MSVLAVGGYAHDERRDQIGEVIGVEADMVRLSPIGDGGEWLAPLEDVQPASRAQELLAKVRVYNERNASIRGLQ